MSASRIILVSLSSFCQKLTNWWKFDQVLTKTILHSFFETRCICYDMHIFNMRLKMMCSQLSLLDNKHVNAGSRSRSDLYIKVIESRSRSQEQILEYTSETKCALQERIQEFALGRRPPSSTPLPSSHLPSPSPYK